MTARELKEIRLKHQLSIVAFAANLGYHPNYIARLEHIGEWGEKNLSISKRFADLVASKFPEKIRRNRSAPLDHP
jgi:hypothetical protein